MKALKWFAIIFGGLFVVGAILIVVTNVYLDRTIKSGHYTNAGAHYSLEIPAGFAARDAAGKRLLIAQSTAPTDTEAADHSRALMLINDSGNKKFQTAQQLKIIEPGIIKTLAAQGHVLYTNETAPDGGHLLIFRDSSTSTTKSYSGSFTMPDSTTSIFFSIALPVADLNDQQFITIAKSIRYER